MAPNFVHRKNLSLGSKGDVWCISINTDCQRVVFGTDDRTLPVWDLALESRITTLIGHEGNIWVTALSNDGLKVISGSDDNRVRIWDVVDGKCIATLEGHEGAVYAVALNSDGCRAASGAGDNTVRVWDIQTCDCLAIFKGHADDISWVAWSPDDKYLLSAASDFTWRLWDVQLKQCIGVYEGHTDQVYTVVLSGDGRRAISGSDDKTLRLWDVNRGVCISTLEGHTNDIWTVAWSSDNRRVVSGSDDGTMRIWDLEKGECTAVLEVGEAGVWSVGWYADDREVLCGTSEGYVSFWSLEKESSTIDTTAYSHYTNAKVLLVGDTGVGKTGLAHRLVDGSFVPTVSTDGVWATQLKLHHEIGSPKTEQDIWLWDFAGQTDYQLIHHLFMEEASVIVLVFNPQSENPLERISYWSNQVGRAARKSCSKLLVAGRCDRGGLVISRNTIAEFCRAHGFEQYIETSARTGHNCALLRQVIIDSIEWNEVPPTISPALFRFLKDEIIKIRDKGKTLITIKDLALEIEQSCPNQRFKIEQLSSVVDLLAGPKIIWRLQFEDYVLLRPECLNHYSGAMIRKLREDPDEIGAIAEEDLLLGKFDFGDIERLDPTEEQVLFRAMYQAFIARGFCFREVTESKTLLIFPAYFKCDRTELSAHPPVFVSYSFSGPLDKIYSTLVVRLQHTGLFVKTEFWRYAVDFETPASKRAGLKMIKEGGGSARILVYFEPGVPDETKVTFILYVDDHLNKTAQDVVRLRHYVCPHCGKTIEDQEAAYDRRAAGHTHILCVRCERRVPLWDAIETRFVADDSLERIRELDAIVNASMLNASKEGMLRGQVYSIVHEAGQIYRSVLESDYGMDGEIEFRNDAGVPSGKKVLLQLKSGDSYLRKRKRDRVEVFQLKKPGWAASWLRQVFPVMLVIRTSDGTIRWMDVTDYLRRNPDAKQIIFAGEPFTPLNIAGYRQKVLA